MAKKKKEAFYKLLMYVVFSLLNSKVDTELKSVLGRADVVIKTQNDIYVLELKVDDTVDNALAQIDSMAMPSLTKPADASWQSAAWPFRQRLEISSIGVQWIRMTRSSTSRSSDAW